MDSQEAPLLEDDELPQGVESVVQVTEEQAEAGRGLLFQQVAFHSETRPDISGRGRKERKDE